MEKTKIWRYGYQYWSKLRHPCLHTKRAGICGCLCTPIYVKLKVLIHPHIYSKTIYIHLFFTIWYYEYIYIYKNILYCHYECMWYECDAVDPLQDELMSARPGSSGFPAFQIGCKDSPRCSMCPFCLRFLSWRRAGLPWKMPKTMLRALVKEGWRCQVSNKAVQASAAYRNHGESMKTTSNSSVPRRKACIDRH